MEDEQHDAIGVFPTGAMGALAPTLFRHYICKFKVTQKLLNFTMESINLQIFGPLTQRLLLTPMHDTIAI